MAKYKKIIEELDVYFKADLDSRSFDQIRESLNNIENNYPDHRNFRIELIFGGDDGDFPTVFAERDETDEERNKRLAKMRKNREKNKVEKDHILERDRKEYERLKRKFGGK